MLFQTQGPESRCWVEDPRAGGKASIRVKAMDGFRSSQTSGDRDLLSSGLASHLARKSPCRPGSAGHRRRPHSGPRQIVSARGQRAGPLRQGAEGRAGKRPRSWRQIRVQRLEAGTPPSRPSFHFLAKRERSPPKASAQPSQQFRVGDSRQKTSNTSVSQIRPSTFPLRAADSRRLPERSV